MQLSDPQRLQDLFRELRRSNYLHGDTMALLAFFTRLTSPLRVPKAKLVPWRESRPCHQNVLVSMFLTLGTHIFKKALSLFFS